MIGKSYSFIAFAIALFYYGTVEACQPVDLKGNSLVPVITPFNDDGTINLSVIPEYAAYLYSKNISAIELFKPNGGEPYSLNVCERKSILRAWVNANQENNYGFVIVVGCGFLTVTDSCDLAAFSESLNVDAISYKPNSDAGPSTPAQAESDLNYIAKCAPSTPIYYTYAPYFTQCTRNPNIGQVVRLCIQNVPTFAGLIAPIEQCLLARAYSPPDSDAQFIVSFYYSVGAANLDEFDAHSDVFRNIFPEIYDRIDNARNTNATLAAQDQLNSIAVALCDQRPDCRLPCPLNIVKAAMEARTGIDVGNTRPPLCRVTDKDRRTVNRILKSMRLL